MREHVARVRRLLEEAVPAAAPRPTAESEALKAFSLFEINTALPHFAEQTPRARSQREIARIANWYGWLAEVDRALDAANVMSIGGLDDAQLEALHARMSLLEDCVQNGGDAPDAPHAR